MNLFAVPGGYAVPVNFGGKAETATVCVRKVPDLAKMQCDALHPGKKTASAVKSSFKNGVLELTVPLLRGCAMVQLQEQPSARILSQKEGTSLRGR